MTLADELAADMADAISGYEQEFKWKGSTYPCVRKSAPAGLGFEDGGEVEKISEMIVVARASFTGALPQVGDGIDNNTAQIKAINPSLANLAMLIGSFDE